MDFNFCDEASNKDSVPKEITSSPPRQPLRSSHSSSFDSKNFS